MLSRAKTNPVTTVIMNKVMRNAITSFIAVLSFVRWTVLRIRNTAIKIMEMTEK